MAQPVPPFLLPVIAYISSTFPFPINTTLVSVLMESLRLFSALADLSQSLLTANWTAQELAPPLISLFLAYLALLSVYRATTWSLRLGFWLVKWGVVVGLAIALAGWAMGNGREARGFNLGHAVLGTLDKLREASPGGRTRSHARSKSQEKPKPWDSFERHQEWQYQANQERQAGFSNMAARQVIAEIYDYFKEGWGQVLGDDTLGRRDGQEQWTRTSKSSKKSKVR